MTKKYAVCLVTIFSLLLSLKLAAQNTEITVTGTVTSSEDEALPGVSVVVKGTTTGTVTDTDGKYALTVPDTNGTLVFSFIGFTTEEVLINSQTKIDMSLFPNLEALDEVVVVGYTKQSRSKTIASVSKLNEEELKNIPSASPVQALQGKLAGVSIPVLSGQPGSAANIVIRGGTTLNPYGTGNGTSGGNQVGSIDASSPLVIVDGVFRSFNDVNPDDIESIQVLKDAASTAVYGARGANGVILIKTKSGKTGSGKANITFRYQHGVETQAREYDYLNAREYLVLARQTWAKGKDAFDIDNKLYVGGNSATVPTYTEKGKYGYAKFTPAYIDNLIAVEGQGYVDNLLANGWETVEDPVNPGKTIIFKDSHYQDLLWNTAHSNNYNFNIDGGTEKANYFFSLGYLNQDGIFIGTNYKRFSSLSNLGFKVNDKFRIDANFSYIWTSNQDVENSQNTLTRGTRVPPLNRIYNEDGSLNLGEGLSVRNRLHELHYQDQNYSVDRITFRLAGDYEILKGLHYRPSASINFDNSANLYFEKYFPQQAKQRDKYESIGKGRQIMTDHILQYDHTFASRHNLTLLAGFNYTYDNRFFLAGSGQRSATDYISTFTNDPVSSIINGQVQPNFNVSSDYPESKTASYFGQLNYDFDGKYLLSGSLRYDGFSNFAPNNRYAVFPSVSAGWNIHRENFWNLKFINQLKLRTSYGRSGLSNLSYTDTYGGYRTASYASSAGIYRNNLANPNLLWETSDTYDAGIDIGLFNRINILVDFYDKLTSNRLDDLPLASESGFTSIKYNAGQLRNRGIEVEIGATVLNIGAFTWRSNFSFAYNRTTVVKLPENDREKNRIGGGFVYDPAQGKEVEVGGYAEGERPGGLWAYKSNGIFATDAEAAASEVEDRMVTTAVLGKPKHGGDVNWADLNGDNIIDSKDLVFMGYRVPDKIGGMQNIFQFKGLTVRFTMDFAMG
ncbi:MAG TPA: SusC/RagA family TonB-linked outer membrane protein, partial [Cytophagales bacterium]|nr:SusC/RagA family TonB-linked outer membrane protein [Cytophagales bacterium]